jgi:hypothetical protein
MQESRRKIDKYIDSVVDGRAKLFYNTDIQAKLNAGRGEAVCSIRTI